MEVVFVLIGSGSALLGVVLGFFLTRLENNRQMKINDNKVKKDYLVQQYERLIKEVISLGELSIKQMKPIEREKEITRVYYNFLSHILNCELYIENRAIDTKSALFIDTQIKYKIALSQNQDETSLYKLVDKLEDDLTDTIFHAGEQLKKIILSLK